MRYHRKKVLNAINASAHFATIHSVLFSFILKLSIVLMWKFPDDSTRIIIATSADPNKHVLPVLKHRMGSEILWGLFAI